jgi:flavin reductase ActVB
MAVTQDEFRAALSRFPSGVTVVTTADADGRLFGITVSAFCSVSLEPPMILVCIERTTGSHQALTETGALVVNILSEDQVELSERFASVSAEKFDDLEYEMSNAGLPVLAGIAVSLECTVNSVVAAGDHSIFIAGVDKVHVTDAEPLVYFHSEYRALGR